MSTDAHQKVTARHLERHAYLYVRQSTMRQVLENTRPLSRLRSGSAIVWIGSSDRCKTPRVS